MQLISKPLLTHIRQARNNIFQQPTTPTQQPHQPQHSPPNTFLKPNLPIRYQRSATPRQANQTLHNTEDQILHDTGAQRPQPVTRRLRRPRGRRHITQFQTSPNRPHHDSLKPHQRAHLFQPMRQEPSLRLRRRLCQASPTDIRSKPRHRHSTRTNNKLLLPITNKGTMERSKLFGSSDTQRKESILGINDSRQQPYEGTIHRGGERSP